MGGPVMAVADQPPSVEPVGPAARLVSGAVVAVFLAAVVLFAVIVLGAAPEAYFTGDDWGFIQQSGSLRGLVRPYNDQLSIATPVIYRALIEGFGFSYGPFRVVALLGLVTAPVAYFVTTRRAWGTPLAAALALSLLGLSGLDLRPATLNHYLILVGAIGCAAALTRDRRADWLVMGGVALCLTAGGGGVAVGAAAVVYCLCTRATLRRWLAVGLPCSAWFAWWFLVGRDAASRFAPDAPPSLSEVVSDASRVIRSPFEYLAGSNPVVTGLLVVAFLAYAAWLLRHGLRSSANLLAWSTALVVWSLGLAVSRGFSKLEELELAVGQSVELSYRYRLLALGFLLLALVPPRGLSWPAPGRTSGPVRWLAVVVLVVLGSVRVVTLPSDIETTAAWWEAFGRLIQAELLVLDLGPAVVPDEVPMGDGFFDLSAGEVRALIERHGTATVSTGASVDQGLVDLGVASAQIQTRGRAPCRPLSRPIVWSSDGGRVLSLSSDQADWEIHVRRFGNEWVRVADARAGQRVALNLPMLSAKEPWQVRADSACRIERGT